MKASKKPVLPGQSRSRACSTTCGRLLGHKGSHRPTLSARANTMPKASAATFITIVGDDGRERTYQLVVGPKDREERKAEALRAMAKAAKVIAKVGVQSPKATRCRISKDGVRCDRAYGHKAEGLRHRFTGRVVNLPEGESKRLVAATANGQHRTARRPKAAPKVGQER